MFKSLILTLRDEVVVWMAFAAEAYRSVSIPSAELSIDEYRAIRQMAVKKIEDAIRAKGKSPANYAIRDLQPTDLGFSTDVWSYTYSAATTEENVVNMTVGDDKFIVIYAVANRSTSPVTTRLTFYKGTIPLKKINLEDMYIEDVPKKVLDEPLVWAESDTLKIVGYAESASTDRLIFKGFIAEPKGETVSTR